MEYWDICDEQGKFTGKQVKKGEALLETEFHFAAELWIVNTDSQLLLQKRSERCEILPGIWGLTTGRMQSGENTVEGCVREAREELGLTISAEELQYINRIVRKDGTHLIWDVYCLVKDFNIEDCQLQIEEVDQIQWVEEAEFYRWLMDRKLFYYPEIKEILHQVMNKTRIAQN